MSRSFDAPVTSELPALLIARRKFDPSRMSALDRREFERETAVARVRQAVLRAETMQRNPGWWSS